MQHALEFRLSKQAQCVIDVQSRSIEWEWLAVSPEVLQCFTALTFSLCSFFSASEDTCPCQAHVVQGYRKMMYTNEVHVLFAFCVFHPALVKF